MTQTPPRPQSALDERERPQPYPPCYTNLIAGRTTGLVSSTSPAQVNQPGIYNLSILFVT